MSEIEADYMPLKIEAIKLYGGGFEIDIYIKLSEQKYLKISHKNEYAENVLDKYIERGLEKVYLVNEDYKLFTNTVRSMLLEQIHAGSTAKEDVSPEDDAEKLNSAHDVMKTLFCSGQIDEDSLELSKAVTKETVRLVGRTSVWEKFKEFREKCSEEYLQVTMVSWLAGALIDRFDWGNDIMKEKVALAAMMCDIFLTKEEFGEMRKAQGSKEGLSSKIIQHPVECAQRLAKESKYISSETLLIIEQHHEMPSGNGYPKGVGYQKIAILTAVYIVANYFVERMFDETYEEEHKIERMKTLVTQIKNKFYSGPFRKVSDQIEDIFT